MTLKVRAAPIATEVARTDELDHAPVVVAGMNLSADLADDVVPFHGVADRQAFAQVQRHRFLQINVLAGCARRNRLQARASAAGWR
jgi:hypothetical protein